jgi:hypothetical protein
MFQTKVAEYLKTHIFWPVAFSSLENPAVYEIMWKNSVETDRTPMTYGACALDAG